MSSAREHGGLAFPLERVSKRVGGAVSEWTNHPGLTKREYYAAKAMQALIAASFQADRAEDYHVEIVAENAFKMADAMLAESEK